MKKIILIFAALTLGSAANADMLIDYDVFVKSEKTQKWFAEVENYDFSSSDIVFLVGGQTSCNVGVQIKDTTKDDGLDKIGKFIPENPAGNPNTETGYYNLARLLGVEKYVQKAVPYVLDRTETAKFAAAISPNKNKGTCKYLLNKIAKSPDRLEGSFKGDLSGETIDVKDYYTGDALRTSKKVSAFLRQGQAKPTDKIVALDTQYTKAKNTELELTRSLFTVLVLDVLLSQHDRYSGGNFTAQVKGEEVVFIAKDNGGTYLIPGYTNKNLAALEKDWFNRYSKPVMDTLEEVESFMNGEVDSLSAVEENAPLNSLGFAQSLGLIYTHTNQTGSAVSVSQQLSVFKRNLDRLLAKYRRDLKKAGSSGNLNEAYFEL